MSDRSFSLQSHNSKFSIVPDASAALAEAINSRKIRNELRQNDLNFARSKSLFLDTNQRVTIERLEEERLQAKADLDEQNLVEQYRRGDHIFRNEPKEQNDDSNREERLYDASALAITNSSTMRTDGHLVGKVQLPPVSMNERVKRANQETFLAKMNGSMNIFHELNHYRNESIRLRDCVNNQEEEFAFILHDVEASKEKHDYDWQVKEQEKARKIQAKTIVDREDLDYSDAKLEKIRNEISLKYPEMSVEMDFEREIRVEQKKMVTKTSLEEKNSSAIIGSNYVNGWIVGKQNSDGQITTLLFGKFTREEIPPPDGYLFVGKNLDVSVLDSQLLAEIQAKKGIKKVEIDEEKLNGIKKILPEQQMKTCARDKILIEPVIITDLSVKANLNNLRLNHLFYNISGCSIEQINGRYIEIEGSDSSGCLTYQNVRGWTIFRCSLNEIPELGIFADSCYSALEGPSMATILDERAGVAYEQLVSKTSGIVEGSVQFKRRFAEMSRAGNRLINVDQTMSLLHNNQLRADKQSESDKAMLYMLQAMAPLPESDSHDDDSNNNETLKNMHEESQLINSMKSINNESSNMFNETLLLDDGDTLTLQSNDDTSLIEGKKHKEKPLHVYVKKIKPKKMNKHKMNLALLNESRKLNEDSMSNSTKTPEINYIRGSELEIKVTLSRSIIYQVGSQGFPIAKSRRFVSQEAELSTEVTKCIESRESELFTLQLNAERALRKYMESDIPLANRNLDELMGDLFCQMRVVRDATVKVAEVLGAWARLCIKEKDKNKVKQSSIDRVDRRSLREFCVVIAVKGTLLYPLSLPVESSAKNYKRGMDPQKSSTDCQFVGVYKTQNEAKMAFETALANVPSEKAIQNEKGDTGKMIVTLRPCRQHYLLRTSHVPQDLPCEQCATRDFNKPNPIVPQILDDGPLPQFIWKGINYLEKMWTDSSFLQDNLLIKKAVPDLDTNFNPLFLFRDAYRTNLDILVESSNDPLTFLKGKMEQIREAEIAGTRSRQYLKGNELMGVAYAPENATGFLNLDKAADRITNNILNNKYTYLNDSLNMSKASIDELMKDDKNGLKSTKKIIQRPGTSPGFSQWNTLSPLDSVNSNLLSSSFSGNISDRPHSVNFRSWLNIENEDRIAMDRLQRALSILGNSTSLTKHNFHSSVVPESVAASSLIRRPLRKVDKSHSAGSIRINDNDNGDDDEDENGDNANIENKSDRTIYTKASYSFRGAKFITGQMRVPVAHRIDDIWCGTKKGEFAGLTKGRSMRSFEFKDNLLMEGRARVKERQILRDNMMESIDIDYVNADIPLIKKLLKDANKIPKGTILDLTKIQVENFLKHRLLTIKNCIKMQSMFHGNVDRKRVKKMRYDIKIKKLRAKLTREQSARTARALIPQLTQKVLMDQIPLQSKPSFWVQSNMSGIQTVVTVYTSCRYVKRSLKQCMSCRTKSIVRKYDPLTDTYFNDRAPCTCPMVKSAEKWLIHVFDPLSRVTLKKEYTIDEVRKYIKSITSASKLMDPESRSKSLLGKSFGKLSGLFVALGELNFSGALDKSHSMASLRASEESSVLPLLPKLLSPDLLNCIDTRKDLPVDKLQIYNYNTSVPSITSNIDELDRSVVPSWTWEPMTDIKYAKRQEDKVRHWISILENHDKEACLHRDICVSDAETYLTNDVEWANMRFEDSRVRFIETDELVFAAEKRIKEVMIFSLNGLDKVELEEKGLAEDWDQGYDNLEDGSAWKGLNNKRKLIKLHAEHKKDYNETWLELKEVERINLIKIQCEKESHENVTFHKKELENYRPNLEFVSNIQKSILTLAGASARALAATLTMPRKFRNAVRRIQHVNYKLVFIRDALERARKEYRGAWTFLDRKIMALRPVQNIGGNAKNVLRCCVEIFFDSTTGYYIMHVGQDEMPMEESTQHEDFKLIKSDFSDLTFHGLANDIILRPLDVKAMLSKSPSWPAEHLEKPPVRFKHASLKMKTAKLSAASLLNKPQIETNIPTKIILSQDNTSLNIDASSNPNITKINVPVTPTVPNKKLDKRHSFISQDKKEEKPRPTVNRIPSKTIVSPKPKVRSTKKEIMDVTINEEIQEEVLVKVVKDIVVIDPNAFVIPSLRPRALSGVKQWKSQLDRSTTLPATYNLRRKKGEKEECSTAAALFNYLRLQPHTGRPCLGLVHFRRRTEYTSKYLYQCLWYKDLVKESPTIQANLITNRIYSICRRNIIATIFFCMKRFQINIHANGKDLGMIVHTDEVIIRMSSKPILLAAFLCELITNRFSLDTIEFIFENIYIQLPGENDFGGQWRGSFRHEIPRIYFLPDIKTRFRGPIYCTHRFLSGRYFRIMFSMNANDDFRIKLTAPIDSNFWCHMYCNKDIIFEISRDEARAFIAKACVNNELVKNRFLGNLDILHPMNWSHFFSLIIDTIFLAPGVAFTKEIIGNEDGIENSLDIDENDNDVVKDISPLSNKIFKVASKFEAWSLRSKYKLRPKLNSTEVEKISTKVEHPPPSLWTLQLRKDGLSNKLVEVESGVWGTNDLDKFYGEKLSDHYKKRIDLMKKHNYYGASSKTLECKKVLTPFKGIVGLNHLSYWNVRILTDEPKKNFYLNLQPSKINNNSVQSYLAENERKLMFEEDKLSLQYQITDKNIAIQFKLANQLSLLEKELKSILPSFTTKSNKNKTAINILKELRTKVLLEADEMFLKHLSKTNNQMIKIISFNENENQDLIINQLNSTSLIEINDAIKNNKVREASKDVKKPVIKSSKDVKKPIKDIILWMENIISSLNSTNHFSVELDVLLLTAIDPRIIQNYSSQVKQQGMLNFTSADFPRHSLYSAVSLNEKDYNNKFRDSNSWSRNNFFQISTHRGSNQIVNKKNHIRKLDNSSIKTINGKIVMITSPTNGPFDSVGIKVYNPSQRKGWNLVCCPNNPLPLLWPQKVNNEIKLDNNNNHFSLTKFCAERIVWNAILHGTTKAVIHSVTEKLDLTTVDMKNKIADVVDEIKKVTSLLEISKNITNNIQINDYEIDDSCYNNFFKSDKKRIFDNSSYNNTELIKSVQDINKLDNDSKLSTIFDGSHLAIIENPEPFRYFSLLGNIKLYGVFIQADEANSSLSIETDSISLPLVISYFLGNKYTRNHSLPSFVYTNCEIGLETEPINTRANRWMTEYKKHIGWKKDLDYNKMQHKLKTDLRNYSFCNPDLRGDVVLFLRNIEDVALLKQWLSDCYEDYRPIRDARRLRARKEREWRVEKHAYFRRCVFKMASRFKYGCEKMFDHRTHSDEINKNYNESFDLPPYLLRVLFTQFSDMRKLIDDNNNENNDKTMEEKIASISILDEAFLLDTDVAHVTEEALLRFEELPEAHIFTNVTSVLNCKKIRQSKSNKIIYNRHDLQPRIGQLVYALYQLHCFECTRSTNLCKFPGCPFIRNHAESLMKTGIDENPNPEINSKELVTKSQIIKPTIVNDLYLSSDEPPNYSDQIIINNKLSLSDQYKSLLGTGHHPMEISIKLYLLTSQDFLYRLGACYNVPTGLDVDDEIAMESEIDRLEIKRVKELEDLRIHWRVIEEEGRQLRYIHRRWIQQELSNVISGEDILAAKGGEEIINDERLLSSNLIEDSNKIFNSSGYKKLQAQEKENNLITNNENKKEQEELNKTNENSNDKNIGMLICLPKTLIMQMLGGVSGCDGKNWIVPYDEIDPYPQINDQERIRRQDLVKSGKSKQMKPMSKILYDWIMSKLYITRPIRLTTPVSGDRGQSLTKKVDVKFDRLHCECVVYLNDGSLVTVLIFHGIINNATLCHDDVSGVPPGAIRYCPIDLIPQLEVGLTIAVYDTKSYKTVCIAIEMSKIFRIAETFKLSPTDFPRISQKILEYSNMVIRLSRVGIICTAASLDLNYISIIEGLQSKRLKEHVDIGNQQNRYGRRHVVSDRRGSRLTAAKIYLTLQ